MEHLSHAAPGWALALQGSALGELMRSSIMLYPAANVVHTLTIAFLLGPIILLDLRLLGLGRAVPLVPAARLATRVAAGAVLVLLVSGGLLFVSDAGALAGNPMMQAKAVLIVCGLTNALAFERLWQDRLPSWDAAPPLAGRLQVLASVALWLAVAACGRLIAYV